MEELWLTDQACAEGLWQHLQSEGLSNRFWDQGDDLFRTAALIVVKNIRAQKQMHSIWSKM